MSSQDPRSAVLAKAVKDPAFRDELKKDPAAAIEKATGVKVPAGVTVKVVEDSAATVHLVLPAAATLGDKELGQVAGGTAVPAGIGQNTQVICFTSSSTNVPCR